METAGLWMLAAVALLVVATGLPAFAVLIGVATVGALAGVATGAFGWEILSAMPPRLVGLLESDLLQALALYALLGSLLNRTPLADVLFRAGSRLLAPTGASAPLAAVGLGTLLSPMIGSVGASAAMLARVVHPRLAAQGGESPANVAVVAMASTFGVVVPPSLVLILLGDAMMRAHTEAVNAAPHTADDLRIINTQDVFHGAIVPAAIQIALVALLAWRLGRGSRRAKAPAAPLSAGEWSSAALAVAVIGGLLGGVAAGRFFAVEAAAMGAFVLLVASVALRQVDLARLKLVLADAMSVCGVLFALLVAATTFTLVFRAWGTDRLLYAWIAALPGGPSALLVAVLAILGACALVLDAFEIIFVVVPIVMPPLLAREPDAVWVSVAALGVLQASFLLPPIGYAVMMTRSLTVPSMPMRDLVRALVPYLVAQLAVLALVVAAPALTHVLDG